MLYNICCSKLSGKQGTLLNGLHRFTCCTYIIVYDMVALLRLDLFLELFIQGRSSHYRLSMGSLDNHLHQLKL